jgi:predicted O-methyltransferase YrrM
MFNKEKFVKMFGITEDHLLRIHKFFLNLGIQVIPDHFYSSVANIGDLERTKSSWAKRSELPGINTSVEKQSKNLKSVCLPFREEYANNLNYNYAVSGRFGPGFGPVEAQAYHAMIRHYRPKRIIEVGAGVSTYCALKATEMNGLGKITCIDPYPSGWLISSGIEVIERKVQDVAPEFFSQLIPNDILFIDGSHTVKPGSDVNYIILEVLPRLNPGVIVHFHDIFLPYDYQIDVLHNVFQWGETSLLRAFLINNSKANILFCMSQLHYDAPDLLHEIFPGYKPMSLADGLSDSRSKWKDHFPASTYIMIS